MVPSAREARAGWDLLIASPGRSAADLLTLRYKVGIVSKPSTVNVWRPEFIVAAGRSPAPKRLSAWPYVRTLFH